MLRPPKPDNEADRLRALSRYQILDTAPEGAFDDLVAIAVAICGMPMGAVTLIDTDRQWFKARIGLDAPETPRMDAFCAHAILDPECGDGGGGRPRGCALPRQPGYRRPGYPLLRAARCCAAPRACRWARCA